MAASSGEACKCKVGALPGLMGPGRELPSLPVRASTEVTEAASLSD